MVMNIFKNEEMCEIEDFIEKVNEKASYKLIQRILAYVFTSFFIIYSLIFVCSTEELDVMFIVTYMLYYLDKMFFTNYKRVIMRDRNSSVQQLRLYKVNTIHQLILLSPFSIKNYMKLCIYNTVKVILWTSLVFFLLLGFFYLTGAVTVYPMKLLMFLFVNVLLLVMELTENLLIKISKY